jgi:hypothetical protein
MLPRNKEEQHDRDRIPRIGDVSLLRNLTELMRMMTGLRFFVGHVPDAE